MINNGTMRKRRDADAEMLRNARILVLTGKLDVDTYERAVADAERSAQEYEAAKSFPGGSWTPAQPPRQLRLPPVRASLSEQDDEEDLLQDFKDHLDSLE